MTSIKGYVEILLMGAAGKLTDQQTHFLQVVRSNTDRLAILVNDLLDVSRIEAGKVTLMMQALDMNKIASAVVATITQRMRDEERILPVDVDIQPGLPSGYGDPDRIQQIMDNLVENAFQYSAENGHIWIRIFRAGQEIQVDIRDKGIGIAPKDQPRIFERFYRGEDPAVLATSGTGLGLSIVKHLVEMHHGRIWFESQGVPGEGSTFSFTLPIYTTQQDVGGSGT
jgi:signal transduction histidine kinase